MILARKNTIAAPQNTVQRDYQLDSLKTNTMHTDEEAINSGDHLKPFKHDLVGMIGHNLRP